MSRADRHAADTDPSLSCDRCDQTTRWKKAEGVWSYSKDPEQPFLCPACARDDRRAEQNHALTEFRSLSGGGTDE